MATKVGATSGASMAVGMGRGFGKGFADKGRKGAPADADGKLEGGWDMVLFSEEFSEMSISFYMINRQIDHTQILHFAQASVSRSLSSAPTLAQLASRAWRLRGGYCYKPCHARITKVPAKPRDVETDQFSIITVFISMCCHNYVSCLLPLCTLLLQLLSDHFLLGFSV